MTWLLAWWVECRCSYASGELRWWLSMGCDAAAWCRLMLAVLQAIHLAVDLQRPKSESVHRLRARRIATRQAARTSHGHRTETPGTEASVECCCSSRWRA
ncbi:hypothetical protein BC831DRAFT_468051 [Entophlyctis helioformis]|nr:hypothetical protein BC831DRAFT_468051 [Entophlyctis helioformis]